MSLSSLMFLRLIVPGILIVIFAFLLGWFTHLWKVEIPDLEKAIYYPSIIAPSIIYYFTPIRYWVSRPFYDKINECLRSGLVSASGFPDDISKFSWNFLRPFFYDLIDHDETLKQKRDLAYFNGAIWSSCADCFALSLIYLCISMILAMLFCVYDAAYAAFCFFSIAILSYVGKVSTTRQQIYIAKSQVEFIKYKYSRELIHRIVNARG